MNEAELVAALAGVPEGADLHVQYVAGREPTPRAVREARRSEAAGIPRRSFFGKLHRVWRTKGKGEVVLTVLCENRDDERTGAQEAYRTFNPSLGTLVSVTVRN